MYFEFALILAEELLDLFELFALFVRIEGY